MSEDGASQELRVRKTERHGKPHSGIDGNRRNVSWLGLGRSGAFEPLECLVARVEELPLAL